MLPTRRLVAAIACAGALALAMPAAAQTNSPSLDAQAQAVADSPRMRGAQDRITEARAEVDAASASLAEARDRMSRATPEELPALEAEERRLQDMKDLRMRNLDQAVADAERIAADERRNAVEGPKNDLPESTTGIVLAPQSAEPAAASAPAPAPAGEPGPAPAVGPLAGSAPVAAAPAVAPRAATAPGAADAATIDAFLASKGSPLTGLGAVFVAEGRRVGLDPRLLVAVSGAETSFGTYGPCQTIHNPFGLGPGMQFAQWADAIRYAASNLAGPLYLGRGATTIPAIAGIWAPVGAANDPGNLNSNWTINVGTYYAAQGGDPAQPVFTGAPAPAAATAAPVFAPAQGLAAATVTNSGPDAAADALELLGTPHSAQDPKAGLDDVALVRTVYAAQGVTLPVRPNAVGLAGEPVDPLALRAGDVLLFGSAGTGNDVVHVGLYIGAGQFVHAPGPGDVVRLASLYDPLWASSYLGARRI